MPALPPDHGTRQRIEREFGRNFLVEAGAGSGKTECLARRMAAGVAAGAYSVDGMAAVTFTRKAAAELRGRFQRALEERLSIADPPPTGAERRAMDEALANLEGLFSGTIHAFCAALLRERPVEAGRAPDFTELDEVEDASLRRHAWREYWNHERAAGSALVVALQEAGVRADHLDGAFARMCEHADVEFSVPLARHPDLTEVRQRTGDFLDAAFQLLGRGGVPAESKDQLQLKLADFRRMWTSVRAGRDGRLVEVLETWDRADGSFTARAKWWNGRQDQAHRLALAFRDEVVRPLLARWREYVYGIAVEVLAGARRHHAEQRRRLNVVNYVDLLSDAARLLRTHPDVRADLQRKFRWLFVDEFQDTDPIQAEILLWLASDPARAVEDPWRVTLRPGALFIVGDPKQSIYRFRRADMEIYTRLRRVFAHARDADVLSLTANFRSRRVICDFVNTFAQQALPAEADDHNPRRELMLPVEQGKPHGREGAVRVLTVPSDLKGEDASRDEAERIARAIAGMVAAGREYGDFLILTQTKASLPLYAEALDRLDIPVEVSGAGRFASSAEVGALALALRALADPSDQAALVGVLRGPLYGLSDPELYAYRVSGGRFDLSTPLDEEDDPSRAADRDRQHGPARAAMRHLRQLAALARRLPLPVALDRIVEETGWLALAATSEGASGAGRILQAIDCARVVLERGGGLADAVEALEGEEEGTDVEAWPLEPGRVQVVRLMNLHKAKGLEAPVVFLADARHGLGDGVDLRIAREGDGATGYFSIARHEGRKTTTVAAPPDWETHLAAERLHLVAERKRLAYVAATRAAELLVVSRLDEAKGRNRDAWELLVPHLGKASEIEVPAAPRAPRKSTVKLTEAVQREAAEARERAHAVVARPSWTTSLVTTEVEKIAWPEAGAGAGTAAGEEASAVRADEDPTGGDVDGTARTAPHRAPETVRVVDARRGTRGRAAVTVLGVGPVPGEAMEAIVPDTPSHRAERNAAWGVLIHGLLEHAMRVGAGGLAADDLRRLGLWLTIDHPELRPHVDTAVAIALEVAKADFWSEAQKAGERHVEVPFAIRIDPGEPGLDGVPVECPTVLNGVIDLVHTSGEGWRVRDYKTGALPPSEMATKYGVQLAAYLDAWTRVAAGPPRGATRRSGRD
jgi:ATP-dependent helicase/nuclease subunit A